VLIIGARRRRQGIGGFVARAFQGAGCDVCAVVGTSSESACAARDELRAAGIGATPYHDLDVALARERPDVVAICSPYSAHVSHLQTVAKAKAHCLCEKPLWWAPSPARADQTREIIGAFARVDRYLDLLTQWPRTLPTYWRLFPELQRETIERFEMRLSPTAQGPDMVPDAAPHVLSMIWALVGAGEVASPSARFGAGGRGLTLDFAYYHAAGVTSVKCDFVTCEEQPRPAWYGVNGSIAERVIEMPGYRMRLRARDGSAGDVPLPDPLPLHVRAFVEDVRRGAAVDVLRLVASVTQLAVLHEAARRAL
jgi:predicted dehydrogenase